MSITEMEFACQTITKKGKVYKYDDLKCQMADAKKYDTKEPTFYVANYLANGEFLKHNEAFFIKASDLKSPMAGNVAAFRTEDEATKIAYEKGGERIELKDAF
ncbi:MAG: nitrous oxide reductase accessory protein NosL [Bacteroidetes bacterium]|nr:nitrous oxide reductase accessory protein NosL [Bacteroidota bacterium]